MLLLLLLLSIVVASRIIKKIDLHNGKGLLSVNSSNPIFNVFKNRR